jgi:methylmalonyl-CoA mutase
MPANQRLFAAFEAATTEAWQRVAVAETNASVDQLVSYAAEGIARQPIYWPTALDQLPAVNTHPGQAPFLRGRHLTHPSDGRWLICQTIAAGNASAANQLAHAALQQGATALRFVVNTPTDLADLLAGITPSAIGLFLDCPVDRGFEVAQTISQLLSAAALADLRGAIGSDPFEQDGSRLPGASLAATTTWAISNAPQLATIQASGVSAYEAGASAAEQLARTMASAVGQLRVLQQHGLDAALCTAHVAFTYAVGSQLCYEIAKLRAARLIWAQIASAFGAQPAQAIAPIHVVSGLRETNQSEPHTNLLLGTLVLCAAAISGADSVEIQPFTAGISQADPFSLRLALNTQHLLYHESHLGAVLDPAGGSWYLESLTDQIAREAWAFFQQIEAANQ